MPALLHFHPRLTRPYSESIYCLVCLIIFIKNQREQVGVIEIALSGIHSPHKVLNYIDVPRFLIIVGMMVDRKTNIKQYSGCANSIPCSCDEEVRHLNV